MNSDEIFIPYLKITFYPPPPSPPPPLAPLYVGGYDCETYIPVLSWKVQKILFTATEKTHSQSHEDVSFHTKLPYLYCFQTVYKIYSTKTK